MDTWMQRKERNEDDPSGARGAGLRYPPQSLDGNISGDEMRTALAIMVKKGVRKTTNINKLLDTTIFTL